MLHNARGDSVDAFQIVIGGDALKGKTLRLGILYGVVGSGKCTLTLTQTVGGREVVTTPPINYNGSALDVVFFDVTNARDGDTFIVNSKSIEGGAHVAGITFDSAAAEKVPKMAEPKGVVRTLYHAPLELGGLFADNGVLQRDMVLPVWGWDDPGTVVTVTFAGQKVEATADDKGRWTAELQPLKASKTPKELVVSTEDETIKKQNILVGDVWLCAGQSNMEMHFSAPFLPRMPTDKPDFVKPAEWPGIRHIRIEGGGAEFPQSRLPELNKSDYEWRVCDDETYKQFTAVGFFFAYTVSKEVDVPIGLINVSMGNTDIVVSMGNTDIVSWLAPEGIESVKAEAPEGVFNFSGGSGLFHGRVAPIAGSGIKGMLWYQGERNGGQGDSYFWKMKALIHGWREAWGRDDIPFYYVQLPSFTGGGSGWAPTRGAQRMALTIPHTGMAVLTDAGDNEAEWPANLHPRNKYTVGQRLALWALAKDYGKTDLVYSGPLFKAAEFKDGKAIVSFDHVGSGLMAAKKVDTTSIDPPKPVVEVVGFEIAAADKQWHPAKARIDGGKAILSADAVNEPVAVRYLYTMNTDHGTLYNQEGLPACPFRTDDW